MNEFTVFEWDVNLEEDVKTCKNNELLPFLLRYCNHNTKVIEAGAGTGRWVKYFQDKGIDIVGIEYNPKTIMTSKLQCPSLNLKQGNILDLPF